MSNEEVNFFLLSLVVIFAFCCVVCFFISKLKKSVVAKNQRKIDLKALNKNFRSINLDDAVYNKRPRRDGRKEYDSSSCILGHGSSNFGGDSGCSSSSSSSSSDCGSSGGGGD